MSRRKRSAEDFRAEIDAHIELETARLREQGLAEEDARAAARRAFGNRTAAEEQFYERGRWPWLDALRQDVRLGWRLLAKAPGWTAVVLLTAGLGIGASVAMFSVVYAVVLRPLPYPGGDRIYVIKKHSDADVDGVPYSFGGTAVTFDTYNLLRDTTRAFEHIAAWTPSTAAWLTDDGPRAVSAGRVTSDFFATFGVQPLYGRAFLPEEDGTQGTAILSHGFWQRAFGGDSSVVGRSISLNVWGGPRAVTIVGIMPPELDFPRTAGEPADLWVPWPRATRGRSVTYVVARASPAATAGLIASDMERLDELASSPGPGRQVRESYVAEPLREQIGTGAIGPLYVFAGATGLMLLIVCFNIANLLLARASSRQREIAVRGALGAPRRRIVQQLLTESSLIALAGGCVGVGLAWLALGVFNGSRQAVALGVTGVAVDGWVAAFAVALMLISGLVFGLAPVWSALGFPAHNALQRDAHRATASAGTRRTRQWLVVGQLGFSLTLLIGAGLLGKSYYQIWSTDPGFDPRNLVIVSGLQARVAADWPRLTEALGAIPGVDAVALSNAAPGTDEIGGLNFTIDGGTEGLQQSQWTAVSAGFFETLGVPLRRGRLFTAEEAGRSPIPVVVNEAFARRFFAGDAVSRRLTIPGESIPGFPPSDPEDLVIVGVVGDFRQHELELEPELMIYWPLREGYASSVIRTRTDARPLIPTIRRVVTSFQPDRPPPDVATVEQRFSDSLSPRRFQAVLIGGFALVATILAIVGVYGVMSYLVALRTKEVGIRMALGARPANVRMMILREGAVLGAFGALAGLAGAAGLTRYLTSLLLNVSPYDPVAFAALTFVLLGAVLAACYVTARRAADTNVLTVLRHD
jgi:predicted permease